MTSHKRETKGMDIASIFKEKDFKKEKTPNPSFPPCQGASSKLRVKPRAQAGSRGGLDPWDPPLGLGADGLHKSSTSMRNGKKLGMETPEFSLGEGNKKGRGRG